MGGSVGASCGEITPVAGADWVAQPDIIAVAAKPMEERNDRRPIAMSGNVITSPVLKDYVGVRLKGHLALQRMSVSAPVGATTY